MLIDRKYDICVSMTWAPRGMNHGMCGHIFEIIDYYLILKLKYKVCILLAEDITIFEFLNIVTSKYDLSDTELKELHENIIIANRPSVVMGNNILFVDGLLKHHLQENGVKLIFKNIFTFRCSYKSTHHDLIYKNIRLLQDRRVYDDGDNDMSIDYIKKIYFARYKNVICSCFDVAMIYVTNNCRYMTTDQIDHIIQKYNYDKYNILTDLPEIVDEYKSHDKVQTYNLPVTDLFSTFNTYIYTPTTTRFDCSPRFIAECKYYNKDVIYHDIDNEYLEDDTGLKYRRTDLSNLSNVTLEKGDDIFTIIERFVDD